MEGPKWWIFKLVVVSHAFLCLGSRTPKIEGGWKEQEGTVSLCTAFVLPFGYPCYEYTVPTEDGFLIGVQRIPFGVKKFNGRKNHSRPAVVLQHGLLQGGDSWLLNPPNQSLGFILADEGFDVWIANGRGTLWSHGHESLSKNDKEYWDWTWDELATYDIPAIIELAHRTTGSQVFYVGHSQGTIIGLAALTQPKVLKLVAAAALLSPISYLDHITSKFLKRAAFLYVDTLVKDLGLREFNLYSKIGVEFVDRVCASPDVDCGNVLAAITGPNCCFNASRIPYYLQYEPQSTSLKNMQHLAQMVRKGTFGKFDYGWLGNMKHYSQVLPPAYALSNIPDSFPLWMAYGGNDFLSDTRDVVRTLQQLTCNPRVLYLDNYAHLDFVISTRAKEDLYDDMITFFKSKSPQSQMY